MLSPIFIRVSEIWRQWDLLVSRNILYTLKSIGWDVDPISPATKDYIAVESPTFLISNLLFYIVIIGFGRARIRRTQRKQDLQNGSPGWVHFFVIIHNIFLILLSLYMCCGCIFIMLLKGNIKQISFLHVYHHATISFTWWMITRKAPGGDAYFSAALNSWVHVCMYTYYLSAALLGKNKHVRKKYLWWGKYLTQLQILQFVLNLLQAMYCSAYSPYPKWISRLLFVYMLSLLVLFGQFYYTKHIALEKRKLR